MLEDKLSTIIRRYKGRVTFEARKINDKFAWQSRFYDQIIWDDSSLKEVSDYIINNPKEWHEDQHFK
ncbi:MAG: hypothetical protein DA405_04965 [Bacteroidetes bacterium]|nr:MAG: hypothetical protein DA405_04965 [Bacteroidota bacterium]